MDHRKRLRTARSIADIFEIVQSIVREALGQEQAGLLVGVTDLGAQDNGFIGAFYALGANTIIINNRPLMRIEEVSPELYFPYLLHVMLHEYVHSVGFYDEEETRDIVRHLSRRFFGPDHTVTQLASHIEDFLPELTYPSQEFQTPEDMHIEFVTGIDRRNVDYIG